VMDGLIIPPKSSDNDSHLLLQSAQLSLGVRSNFNLAVLFVLQTVYQTNVIRIHFLVLTGTCLDWRGG